MSALSSTCTEICETSTTRPSRLRNLLSAVMREIRIRRAIRELSALDDTMLKDVGLEPGSIENAARYGRR